MKAVLNGVRVNEGWGADPAEGYIYLQSEGWPVFYCRLDRSSGGRGLSNYSN